MPEFELLMLVALDPCPMRDDVPVARPVLEPGLGARTVMPERPFHNGGMEDRDGAQEINGPLCGVDIDGVLHEVQNLMEKSMFEIGRAWCSDGVCTGAGVRAAVAKAWIQHGRARKSAVTSGSTGERDT